ncbi:Competence protein ComEC [Paramixta manurensis]|uniref:Competence protein ComEC n=1 Tax=Paramixta manurensis TaxID=2740817 RepID=A0A6M8UA89_9GAMM|nr:Competence protein ComEC [Erwiniaceae bacterium PD-1]
MIKSVTQLAWAIISGVIPLHFLPELPAMRHVWTMIIAVLLLIALPWSFTRFIALVLLFFLWAVSEAKQMQYQIGVFSAQTVSVEVRIESMDGENKTRIKLMRYAGQPVYPPLYADIYDLKTSSALCAGQRWRMALRLRPVHARLNEGEFDRQRFMLANATPLTGKAQLQERLEGSCGWRQRIMAHSYQQYHRLKWQSIMTALLFGERQEVSAELNQLLRETGTAHLMAISGLHIALAASCGWLLARGLQRFIPSSWIGFRFPLFCNLMVGVLYVWLSGNQPPAIRTLVGLCVWCVIRLNAINCQGSQVWSICVALILLFDPFSVFSDSFWLSVLAAGALIIWCRHFPLPNRFAKRKRWVVLQMLHIQVGITLLLMPVQAWLFHGISLSSLVANLWAVPLVSFVSVPLLLCGLIGSFFSPLSDVFWRLTNISLEVVFRPLQALPAGWMTFSHQAELACLLCWLLAFCWRFGWLRSSPVAVCGAMLVITQPRHTQPEPVWRLDMLDVGHGLAMVISRQGHALVYDTGNRWARGDAGKNVIAPWLRWHGLQLDQVILSHGHLDHRGGLASLQAVYPDISVRSALGNEQHLPCKRGERWQWQGLHFYVLWPENTQTAGGNNDSCVLSVTDGRHRVLLTGDLEEPVEKKLVTLSRNELRADILQVPHHGSRSSSSPPFLRVVNAQLGLASAARYNAWRLPASKIIERYQRNSYQWRDTALSGQLSVRFYSDKWVVFGFREQILPRWYHQWFGVPRDSR